MARFHPPQRCVLVCGKVRKGANLAVGWPQHERPFSGGERKSLAE